MDYMNIDEVLEVHKTPGRLAENHVNDRDCIEKEGNSSVNGYSGNTNSCNEVVRHWLRDRAKVVISNGQSRSLSLSPSENLSISEKPECHNECPVSALNRSSSSMNAHLFSRTVADKTARYDDKDYFHSQHKGKGRALCTSQSSDCQEDFATIDLTQQKRHAQEFEQAFLGNFQVEENMKGLISTGGFSSLNGVSCPSTTSGNDRKGKGKEKVVDARKGDSGFACGKGINFYGDSQPNAGKLMSASLNSIISPRVTGQKRLVRSGCESPHDIVKAKQTAEKHNNCVVDLEHNDTWIVASNSPPNLIDLVAEDNDSHRVKGKGVMDHPFLAKEPGTKTMHLTTSDNEKANRISDVSRDAFGCFDGLGGLRSIPNCTKKTTLPLSDEGWHLSRRKDDHNFVNRHHKKRVLRKNDGDGISKSTGNDSPKDWDADLLQHGSASPGDETVSHMMSQLDQFDAECHAAISLMEKLKQSSTSSNHVNCSTSGFVNQPHENSVLRKNNEEWDGICNRTGNDSPKDWDEDLCQHRSASPVAGTVSHMMSQLHQFDAECHAAISLMEKQKQSSTLSNHVKCSASGIVNQSHENRVLRKNNEDGICNRTGHDSPKDWDAASQHGSTPPVAPTASCSMSWLDQFDECCRAATSLNKRLKHSTSSDHGECSTSSSANQPPEYSDMKSDNRDGMSNSTRKDSLTDWDADSRQHGSAPAVAQTASRIKSHLGQFDERCHAAISHMERQKEDSTSSNRGESSRAGFDDPQITYLGSSGVPSYSRSNRIQNCLCLGISDPVNGFDEFMSRIGNIGSRNIGCSSNDDSDPVAIQSQAIDIDEALEAFSVRGLPVNLLPVQRVSIEDDYEMLLALDENKKYVGASVDQINGLPETTVQTDSFKESCAICLEIPTTGDTIRHLPCLHKFHKDCIDPWLGIRTSCPVCKCSII